MGKWLLRLARWRQLRAGIPLLLKRILRHFPAYQTYALERMRVDMDARAERERRVAPALQTDVTLGIVKEFSHLHNDFVNACLEMGIPYKLIDISHDRWIEEITESDCQAFLVRPSDANSVWKRMYDDRLRIMESELGQVIYPSCKELWLYESKRRCADWLRSHNVPCPRTAVFYQLETALAHLSNVGYPLVYKADIGSGASGVRILRNKRQAYRQVLRCFRQGSIARDGDPRDRQWGYVILQEYLLGIKEWRVVRIGSSYFAHQKLQRGGFHSGSNLVGWYDPPRKLLDFVRDITKLGAFTSMDVDVFETPDGRYLVNELQTFFGWEKPSQMYLNGEPARYIDTNCPNGWQLEKGTFCRNGGANLRIEVLFGILGVKLQPWQ